MSAKGQFVWFDLLTPQADSAVAFYRKVFDWELEEVDMGPLGTYPMFKAGPVPLGGVDTNQVSHIPTSTWLGYIGCDDADQTTEQAQRLGATLIAGPFDVPNVGRYTIMRDPGGALFAPFQPAPGSQPPEDTDAASEANPAVGAFTFHELNSPDRDQSYAFYAELFGWEKGDAVDIGDGSIYQLINRRDQEATYPLAGMMSLSPSDPTPPHWNFYIRVGDVDVYAKRFADAGGTIVMGPMDVPGGSRVATGTDPTGATVSITSW